MFKSLLSTLTRKLKKGLVAIFFALFPFQYSGRLALPTGEQLEDIGATGFFGQGEKVSESNLYKSHREAIESHADGEYHKAVHIQREILRNVYRLNKIEDDSWNPKFLSYYYGGYLGHRALVGIILMAQKIGLISDTNRLLPYGGEVNEQQLKVLFQSCKNLELIRSDYGNRCLEGPLNWHLSERLWMIKTKTGFFETQQFVDDVFAAYNKSDMNSPIILDDEYLESARNKLENLGLPKDKLFVALHVRRKAWNAYDIRQAKIENYVDSVKEILNQGFYVLQFGTDSQVPILQDKRVLVIQGNHELPRFLTPYILSECEFLINTCSGPTYLAALLGTSVLQTNVIALGKCAPTLTRNSLHLPKRFLHKGNLLSLGEIFSSQCAYTFRSTQHLKHQGYEVLENSSDEILSATLDILQITKGENLENKAMCDVAKLRRELNVPTNGVIAPSFLNDNHQWLFQSGFEGKNKD